MIPQQTFESYPVFGDNATKIKPDDAKYAAGFQQSDVLPAEWMNWAWGKNTKGITDLNRGMTSVETEILNVLTAGGQTPAEATGNQLLQSINYLIGQAETRAKLAAHPVGSLYWSGDSTDPGQLFGGTWAPVKDCFVWAKGDNDTPNAIGQNAIAGGAKTVTLTVNQIPSHTHIFTGTAVTSDANNRGHTHNFEHKHTTGGMSANSTGSVTGMLLYNDSVDVPTTAGAISVTREGASYTGTSKKNGSYLKSISINVSHTHTTNSLTNASGTAITNTGGESQNHTHSVTASGTNANTGGGGAHDNMPPYIIKYCWERTA
jgi:microcystin-dependent protein